MRADSLCGGLFRRARRCGGRGEGKREKERGRKERKEGEGKGRGRRKEGKEGGKRTGKTGSLEAGEGVGLARVWVLVRGLVGAPALYTTSGDNGEAR